MKKGYTLIELVLVITIISILVFSSIYSIKNVNTFRAKEEIINLKKDLEFTRNIAMVNREDAYLYIDQSGYSIKCSDYKKGKKFKYIKFLNSESNLKNVGFKNTGATTFDGAGTLVFEIGKNKYEITIEPITGKVNLKK